MAIYPEKVLLNLLQLHYINLQNQIKIKVCPVTSILNTLLLKVLITSCWDSAVDTSFAACGCCCEEVVRSEVGPCCY